jgi:hypothetical protein
VVCLGPRIPREIVGPRPLSGVVVRPLNFTVRHPVEPLTDRSRAVARLRQVGTVVEFVTDAAWVPELERRFKRGLPPLYRSLLLRFSFASREVGEVELFGNLGWTDEHDITVAPFSDPLLSTWLIDRGYIQFGRPATGSYDPVCFDYSVKVRGSEPTIVSLSHEDVLLDRKKVRKRTVAASFGALLGVRGA